MVRPVVRDRPLRYLAHMVVRAACLVLICLLGSACQDLDVDLDAGEPCTRTSQCMEGLECLAGVCLVVSDGGTDAEVD